MTPLQWVIVGVSMAIASVLVGLLAAAIICTETPDVESTPLPPAGARGREAMGEERGASTAPPMRPMPAAQPRTVERDESIGRDQHGPERRRSIRDLQPLTLRQREALGLVKKEH
jgi:hypothetical protein